MKFALRRRRTPGRGRSVHRGVEVAGRMLELRTLGTVQLIGVDGGAIHKVLAQPKRLALLVYLAASPPGFVRRDSLVALFWPEHDNAHARASLRQAVHVLRAALGSEVLTSCGDEALGLAPGALWSDARQFERLVDAGRLAEALSLYRGDFLEGFYVPGAPGFEPWLENRRARLRGRAGAAAWALSERVLPRSPESAGRWARWAASLTPEDETVLRRLVLFLDRLGDRVGVARAYREFSERAAVEFGVEPSPETRDLVRHVLARGAPAVQGVTSLLDRAD